MSTSKDILKTLNERQKEAVIAPPGPLLITAGAGSGKTAVLVRRIAWLIESEGVAKHNIIAVTFTNKAAREMRERVIDLLGEGLAPRRIGTFHGLSNRFLRKYHLDAGLSANFTILDSDDQYSLIKHIVNEYVDENPEIQELVDRSWVRGLQFFINDCKERKKRSYAITREDAVSRSSRKNYIEYAQLYEIYEQRCESRNLLDFTELLFRTIEVLDRNEIVRSEVQDNCHHLLVDEFQDSNALQLEWVQQLAGKYRNVTVVGDEDQSIYGWRGAVPDNMMTFAELFPNTKIVQLEQNYRSTSTILAAANAVIDKNPNRFKKKLWTSRKSSEPILRYDAYNGEEEALFVAETIAKMHRNDLTYSDFAVLYRTNAQSRNFEEAFGAMDVPFKIYGGTRFYARLEIKHILAYLRLIIDPLADEAFRRIINVPARNIGARALEVIENHAVNEACSLWDAACDIADDENQSGRIRGPLKNFIDMIELLEQASESMTFPELISEVIKQTKLREYYMERPSGPELTRIENLDELINAAVNFSERYPVSADDPVNHEIIRHYLDDVTIDAGDTHDDDEDAVQVMTLHTAKGLEFPVVFLVGMDENLLPHFNAIRSSRFDLKDDQLEEERRLCYVGMTRAEKTLILTRARVRLSYGERTSYFPSRYFKEIPSKYISQFKSDRSRLGLFGR